MIDSSSYDNASRIYALANPRLIAEQESFIRDAVFGALQVKPSDKQQFGISESSGWLDYLVVGELWERKALPTLPEKDAAIKAAEAFLLKLEQAISPANPKWPDTLAGISLLPSVGQLRRAELFSVSRPNNDGWDHWLYRAEPQLYLDGGMNQRISVFGSQIEVRIGHNGQIISFRSRWRPITGEKMMVDPVDFVAPIPESSQAEELQDPVTMYLLEGDGVPQHYLAPYYFQTDGHDILMSSASAWSLCVDIGRTSQTANKATYSAVAQGGSGDYRYNWGYYRTDSLDAGIIELGSGETTQVDTTNGKATMSSIDIKNGHLVLLLNVKDRATGAFKHHQQFVFSGRDFTAQSDGEAVA